MKGIIIISLILLAGLASAFTPEQQTILDGMNLSYELGIAYEDAIRGQDATTFNALVDQYNAWIRQHFGENAGLLKSKINEPASVIAPLETNAQYTTTLTRPFNASSDLSKFGKKEVYAEVNRTQAIEDQMLEEKARNL